jgi:dienelactone hydrolase
MTTAELPKIDPQAFDRFIQAQGLALRGKDEPPASRKVWLERRTRLRDQIFKAMGPIPPQPCPLEAKELGTLKRMGYRIEKLLFQSRPDVWVTATAYVPEPLSGKVPAVLAVHGHWPWARRDPVVQARCLGLVKLGFFVLAVDAFGAGERYPQPGRGTYHGALMGSTLWPVGQTLLGMQVYDNRRAVDYLRSRPEVDGDRLGITGASGGGNQSTYAGALDERFRAVVPVCSVGTYQSYLHAACCVCEVLPGAMRFAEEGDVLSLVAPRALLVISADQDAFQFSPGEAAKSIDRARAVFKLYGVEDKVRHKVFESGHAYSQPMREAMYGWMVQWLKNEGDVKPITEPTHMVESVETLSCFAEAPRPKAFLFPPSFAAREGRALVAKIQERIPDHAEAWESAALYMRDQLRREVLGDFPKATPPIARFGKTEVRQGVRITPFVLEPESGSLLFGSLHSPGKVVEKQPVCILLHLDGKKEALAHPLTAAILEKGWHVVATDLRATGEAKPPQDAVAGAPDHNSAEHALWIGRPLLGQWLFDVSHLLDWLLLQPDFRRFIVVGFGQAGLVALCAGGLFDDRIGGVVTVGSPVTLITDQPYPTSTFMGLLAPGLLRLGDIPHLAALVAPRRLVVADGISVQQHKLSEKDLTGAYPYTRAIYQLLKADRSLTLSVGDRLEQLLAKLGTL